MTLGYSYSSQLATIVSSLPGSMEKLSLSIPPDSDATLQGYIPTNKHQSTFSVSSSPALKNTPSISSATHISSYSYETFSKQYSVFEDGDGTDHFYVIPRTVGTKEDYDEFLSEHLTIKWDDKTFQSSPTIVALKKYWTNVNNKDLSIRISDIPRNLYTVVFNANHNSRNNIISKVKDIIQWKIDNLLLAAAKDRANGFSPAEAIFITYVFVTSFEKVPGVGASLEQMYKNMIHFDELLMSSDSATANDSAEGSEVSVNNNKVDTKTWAILLSSMIPRNTLVLEYLQARSILGCNVVLDTVTPFFSDFSYRLVGSNYNTSDPGTVTPVNNNAATNCLGVSVNLADYTVLAINIVPLITTINSKAQKSLPALSSPPTVCECAGVFSGQTSQIIPIGDRRRQSSIASSKRSFHSDKEVITAIKGKMPTKQDVKLLTYDSINSLILGLGLPRQDRFGNGGATDGLYEGNSIKLKLKNTNGDHPEIQKIAIVLHIDSFEDHLAETGFNKLTMKVGARNKTVSMPDSFAYCDFCKSRKIYNLKTAGDITTSVMKFVSVIMEKMGFENIIGKIIICAKPEVISPIPKAYFPNEYQDKIEFCSV